MKPIRSLLLPAAALIGLTLGILFFVGVTVPLDFLDARLEKAASALLKRDVRIAGPTRLRISPTPRLGLGGVSIGNPGDWQDKEGHLLKVEAGEAQLSLMKLLQGELHIRNLIFDGVDLNLVTRADHRTNYRFDTQAEADEKPGRSYGLKSLDRLSLRNLRLSYHDAFSDTAYTLEIDEALGAATADGPLQFSFSGTISDEPVSLSLTAGTLQELLSGSPSWPFSAGRLTLAGNELDLSGSLDLTAYERAGYLNLAVEGENLDRIGAVFGLSLPDIGGFLISAAISVQPGMLQATGLQVQALESSLQGDLLLSLAGERPFLAGDLTVEVADPAAFAALSTPKPEGAPAEQATGSTLPSPDLLNLVDVDLRLRAGDIAIGSMEISGIAGVLSLVDGGLVLPLALSLPDLPLAAQFELAGSGQAGAVTEAGLRLSSPGGIFDNLFDSIAPGKGLHGSIGPFSIAGSSSGKHLGELLQNLDLSIQAGPARFGKNDQLIVATQSLAVKREHGRTFEVSAAGELLGSPLDVRSRFDAAAEPGPSLSMRVQSCETALLFDGTAVGPEQGSSFTIQLDGRELCGLLAPVDQFLGEAAEFSLHASGSLGTDLLALDIETFSLDELELKGALSLMTDDEGTARLSGSIEADAIDLDEMLNRNSTPSAAAAQSAPQAEPLENGESEVIKEITEELALFNKILALEVLPLKKLLGANVELACAVNRLHTGDVDISDIRLTLITENGALKHSPFQARIGGSTFTGSAAVDAAAMPPAANIELATEDFILAEMLEAFGIETAPDVTARAMRLDISLKGRTLKEMLLQAGHYFRLRDGRIVLPRERLIPLTARFDSIDFIVDPGQPAMLSLDGDINQKPLALDMSGDGLFAKGTAEPINLSIQAELADTRLDIDGTIKRPPDGEVSKETFQLSTVLSGSRMDSLDELFGINMPPLGPYAVKGVIGNEAGDDVIRFHDLGLRIGESVLDGSLALRFSELEGVDSGLRTDFEARLNARTIQLNDFELGGWSAVESRSAASDGDSSSTDPQGGGEKPLNLVSPEFAERFGGTIDIEVNEVLSGDDRLGGGELRGRLQDGRYRLDRLQLDIPGGKVAFTGSLHPEPDRIGAKLTMDVKRFDYGIMARRAQPDSTLKGYINLLLDLEAAAPTPLQLREHLNGRFKFGIVPEEYRAGVLDLWAANILTAALPALLKGSSSVVNCLAGDFTIEDGLMQPELFIMDTSKIRVQGKGTVDFRTNAIDFHLRPTPKSASFFSLATPISVTGTIFKPDIGVTAGSVVRTIFSQAASLVTVPFQWLFSQQLEEDGAKVCAEAMRWAQVEDFQ